MSWGMLNCADLEGRLLIWKSRPAAMCQAMSTRAQSVDGRRKGRGRTYGSGWSTLRLEKHDEPQRESLSEKDLRLSVTMRARSQPPEGTRKVSRLGPAISSMMASGRNI